jgi:chromosome segregation ATPase
MRVTFWLLAWSTIALAGCGASLGGSAQTGGSGKSAKDELEQLGAGIEADIKDVMAPLDEADALLADIKAAKAELGASFDASFTTTANGGSSGNSQVDASAQSRVKGLAERAARVAQQLEALPDKCTKLVSNLAERAIQIPQLAVSATAEAQLTLNNPFASAEEKAGAQAAATLVATLPNQLLSKVAAAKEQIASLPTRAAAALTEIASLTGVAADTLVASAPSASVAADVGASSGGSDPPRKEISPFLALDRAGPWVYRGVARGRERIDRAGAALDSLREVLSQPLPRRATSEETQSHTERVSRRALEVLDASASIATLSEQANRLLAAMDELNERIPEMAESAELWADHALADFGADERYHARAKKQKLAVNRLQIQALVAVQLAKHETGSWQATIAELQTSARTLLAQVPSVSVASRSEPGELFEPFPAVAGPPRREEAPLAVPTVAPIIDEPKAAVDEPKSSIDVPLLVTAALTTAALVAAIYTVDRVAALNTCLNMPDGYGCTNSDSLDSQTNTGVAATVVFSVGALGSLIWAIAD